MRWRSGSSCQHVFSHSISPVWHVSERNGWSPPAYCLEGSRANREFFVEWCWGRQLLHEWSLDWLRIYMLSKHRFRLTQLTTHAQSIYLYLRFESNLCWPFNRIQLNSTRSDMWVQNTLIIFPDVLFLRFRYFAVYGSLLFAFLFACDAGRLWRCWWLKTCNFGRKGKMLICIVGASVLLLITRYI